MGNKDLVKFSLLLVGIIILMSACGGKNPVGDSVQELEPSPTLVIVGSTMDKPVPYGYDIMLPEIVISVNEVNRPANGIVAGSSGETPAPENGQEYFLIKINNQCVKPGVDNCFGGFSDYQLLDANGNVVLPESSVSGLEGFFTFEEFSSGTSNQGYPAFLVDQDMEYPFLTYNTFHGTSVYLSLAY